MTPRRNVPVLMATVAAMLAARLTWGRLLPTYYATLGATERQIGTAFTLFSAAFALFQLLGGLLADRIGRKPVAVLPIFGVVVSVAWMARARDWQALLVGHVALAVFASAQSPGFTALLAESVPPEERGRAFGAVSLAARIANAAGPALGAWLLAFYSLPTLLWITVAVGIVVSLVRLLLLQETLHRVPPEVPDGRQPAPPSPSRSVFLYFLLVGGLYTVLFNLLFGGPFVALHARQAMGLDDRGLNLLFALGDGVAILSAPLAGWLGDRVGHRRMMAVAGGAMGLGVLGWALLPPGPLGTLCFVLAAASGPAASIAYSALLTSAVGSARRGAFVGLMGTLTGLLGSPAGRIGAELRAWAGPAAPFWAGLATAGALALALSLKRRSDRG
ncbi:MAG TPA: MFS transporter [Thermoflexia bacterium]|nr:MFS transporter [Thermoflexia bacterium]